MRSTAQTIDTVNGVCATPSVCVGIVGESCMAAAPGVTQAVADVCAAADLSDDLASDAWVNAEAGQQSCAAAGECIYSLYGGRTHEGKIVATACSTGTRSSTGECTETCCDQDTRNYYSISLATTGAVRRGSQSHCSNHCPGRL